MRFSETRIFVSAYTCVGVFLNIVLAGRGMKEEFGVTRSNAEVLFVSLRSNKLIKM